MMNKSLLAATTFSLLTVACIKQDQTPDELRTSIPTADQVQIKLVGQDAKTVGQLADWYVATRDVTKMFNGGSAAVLVLIHTIVETPVTSVAGNVYTWGPGSQALDPADYRLDVTAVGDGTYTYALSGKSKTAANAQWEVVISGMADPRAGDLQGNGEFTLDFDAGRRVNPIDASDATGQIEAHYDLKAKHLDLGITGGHDANNMPVNADYAYDEAADGGGAMTFDVSGNVGGGPALEEITLNSRWQNTGAGRADARIAGGDLGAEQAIATECWGTSFQRLFYTDNVNFAPTEGNAADGAFANQALPPAN
jgi:hypothetical protein